MDRQEIEAQVKAACDAGNYERAATLTLEGYGTELLSFLIARLRNHDDGQEAFSMFVEDLWTGLPGFEFRASVRTWAYTLARNAANRFATGPARRRERNLTFTQNAELSHLAERIRSSTGKHRQTEVRDRVRALREQLDPEDQTLLILRIDRGMAFRDLASVMSGGVLEGDALRREAARLRKRFERVKSELKALAKAEGLLSD